MGAIISTLLFQPPEIPTPLAKRHITWLTTAHGSIIPACYISQPRARYTVLYSHGNAEDLGLIHEYLLELAKILYVNILAYDYSGYGLGRNRTKNRMRGIVPSEANCYNDIDAAYEYLITHKKVEPQNLILYGRSVGSGPSCYLAQRLSMEETQRKKEKGIGGLILHSPFLSVCRVVVDMGMENSFDYFPNVSRIRDIRCPIFIVHGTEDKIVPFHHGKSLFEAIPIEQQYPPFWANGCGHNNIELEMSVVFIKQIQMFFMYLLRQNKDQTRKIFSEKKLGHISSLSSKAAPSSPPDALSTSRSNSSSSISESPTTPTPKHEMEMNHLQNIGEEEQGNTLSTSPRKLSFGKRFTSLRRKGSKYTKVIEDERAPIEESEREGDMNFFQALTREGDGDIECTIRQS